LLLDPDGFRECAGSGQYSNFVPKELRVGRVAATTIFKLLVVVPMVAALVAHAALTPSSVLQLELLFWVLAVAITELLPVPTKGGVQLSLSHPLLLAALVLYPPLSAATVAFVGTFDRRELERSIPVLNALFNRAQIATSILAGSIVFHSLAPGVSEKSVPSPIVLVPLLALATVIDYLVNVTLVVIHIRLAGQASIASALAMLRVGARREFLLNYLGLSLIGVVIVELSTKVGLIAVVAFIAPLVFARQMFFRTMALEEATEELKDRERVLRALSNRMAEERQDERLRIADYLHDDLQQTLFQLTLRLEMAKKRLAKGDAEGVARDLDQLWDIKQETSDMVRGLVNDLHHAPIGRTGLPDALQRLATDMTRGTAVNVKVEVVDVPLPPPIQLLIYQIAREAVLNAMKHAEPTTIGITLAKAEDGVDLTVNDDGAGFDTSQPQPEGHFGSVMMRERAIVTGGTFQIASEPGKGTSVTAHFPEVWLAEGAASAASDAVASTDETATQGAPPRGDPTAARPIASAPLPPSGWPEEDPSHKTRRPASA
jgi:signal transduction histidine kinase